MNLIKITLFCLASCFAFSAYAKPYNEEDKKELLDKIEAKQEHARKAKELAELTDNEQAAIHANNYQLVYELLAKCIVEGKSYQDEDVCYIKGLKELASADNPAAMHSLGNVMEQYKNYQKAIEWYEKALASKNMPEWYRQVVQDDLDRAKSKL